MGKIDFKKEAEKIIKKCGLGLEDMLAIMKLTEAKNYEELYNELEHMLETQVIKIK